MEVTDSENSTDSETEDESKNRFRKVSAEASEAMGRPIPLILFDRSIRGPTGCGGRLRSGHGVNTPRASYPSPSSVIPRKNDGRKTTDSIEGEEMNPSSTQDNDNMEPENTSLTVASESTSTAPDEESRDTSISLPPSRLKLNVFPTSHTNELRNYAEQYSVTKFNWEYLRLGSRNRLSSNRNDPLRIQNKNENNYAGAVSTISISFSPDGRTMASTHGDHSVKITCCHTGSLVRELEGHPRTPWTVKYHPTKSNIVASGCLGFQVRVWDWNYRRPDDTDSQYDYNKRHSILLNMIRLHYAIISLSFHPSGSILAIASGQTLHLWNYDKSREEEKTQRTGIITEFRYDHNLRCVHFPPRGDTIIVGAANPTPSSTVGNRGRRNDVSYSLKLWEFDLEIALKPHLYMGNEGEILRQGQNVTQNGQQNCFQREALRNAQIIVERALLYNDGGFDVSPDGKMLCGCAEFFLPHGVESVIDEKNSKERTQHCSRDGGVMSDESGKDNDDSSTQREAVLSAGEEESQESISDGISNRNLLNSPNRETDTEHECSTPPNNTIQAEIPTSPPSPPGRRFSLQRQQARKQIISSNRRIRIALDASRIANQCQNQAHDTIHIGNDSSLRLGLEAGRYVPHVVIVNLDANIKLGGLIEATPLGSRASSVTCVKFSPSAEFCLLGYGVRENAPQPVIDDNYDNYHPVSAVYRIRGGMRRIVTMLSGEDDVNIARFHPDSGHGFVYGTKQGRLRILSPWPWNYYYN